MASNCPVTVRIQLRKVQILHCGSYQHWIVASILNCPKDTVYLYNSFDENIPNYNIEQIASILCSESPQITIISKPLQTQETNNKIKNNSDTKSI